MHNAWKEHIVQQSWRFTDTVKPERVAQLRALLSFLGPHASKSSILQPGEHFMFCNPDSSDVGADGYHEYQAPIDLKTKQSLYGRRMWAGGSLEFGERSEQLQKRSSNDIDLGRSIECKEKIVSVRKLGDSMFVSIQREFQQYKQSKLKEMRTLVYTNKKFESRSRLRISLAAVERGKSDLSLSITAERIARYSKLTDNSHKIHLDRSYAQQVEGLPDIVAQGPFMVSLLLHWFRRNMPAVRVHRCDYRNQDPWPITDLSSLSMETLGNNGYKCYLHSEDGSKIYLNCNVYL